MVGHCPPDVRRDRPRCGVVALMADNVVVLPVITTLDVPAERVLNGALGKGLKGCVVVGWDEDGGLFFASSYADSAEVIYLLERAKHDLLKMEDELSGG